MRIVAVLGNGSSIPYNPDLAMEPLTERVLRSFAEVPGNVDQVAEALLRLAEAADREPLDRRRTFEDLFGPIERLGSGLRALRDLASLMGAASEVRAAFLTAVRFGEELRRRTVGAALDVVANLSYGQGAQGMEKVISLVRWLAGEAGAEGTVRIFTLNYDALIDAAALDLNQSNPEIGVSDMAQGFDGGLLEVVLGQRVPAYPLRDDDEYTNRIVIYHIHGSLQWVRSEGQVWKVDDLDRLREMSYWRLYAEGQASVEPVVILADQKIRAIEADPFAWAYRRLSRELRAAQGILIGGYGFGDEPLNRVLRQEINRNGCPVLVVDRRADQDEYRNEVLETLSGGSQRVRMALVARLRVYAQGFPDAVAELEWE